MTKLFVVAAALVAIALAFPSPPTSAEVEAELVAAGVSTAAAQGVVAICEKYKDQLTSAADKETGKAAFEEMQTEVEAYIKTQSTADQTAYAAFVEKKKAEHEAHGAASSSK